MTRWLEVVEVGPARIYKRTDAGRGVKTVVALSSRVFCPPRQKAAFTSIRSSEQPGLEAVI